MIINGNVCIFFRLKMILQGSNLQGSILQGSILEGSILEGSILEGSILEGSILQGSIYYKRKSVDLLKTPRTRGTVLPRGTGLGYRECEIGAQYICGSGSFEFSNNFIFHWRRMIEDFDNCFFFVNFWAEFSPFIGEKVFFYLVVRGGLPPPS